MATWLVTGLGPVGVMLVVDNPMLGVGILTGAALTITVGGVRRLQNSDSNSQATLSHPVATDGGEPRGSDSTQLDDR